MTSLSNSTFTYQLKNVANLPITIVTKVVSSIFNYFSSMYSKITIMLLNTEQNEVTMDINMASSLQKELNANLKTVKQDQDAIEKDIDHLKSRLERLEARRAGRLGSTRSASASLTVSQLSS